MIAVSACLAGRACRYDGKANTVQALKAMVERGDAVPICPEVLGGLGIPRDPCERQGCQICTQSGRDCTTEYRKGAEAALTLIQKHHITLAVLKAKSPSCGKGLIYDGSFTRTLTEGHGLTAELFIRNGVRVFTEDEWQEEKENSQKA